MLADYREGGFANHVPDADVIIATWWETAFAVQTLPPEKGRKVYFVQGHEVHAHMPSHISAGSYYLPIKKVTIAGWLRDTLQDLYGASDVPVVHNSVDSAQFYAPPRARRPAPTIGFMYSHTPFKGAQLARTAIAEARRQIPDLQVVAFGASTARAGRELPEGTRYFRQPPQDKLRDIYAMCDGWLMPSHSEGFALPVLEAMACRTPVISTRTGIGPDIIEDGRNGFLVDPGDAHEMADRIVRLLSQDKAAWSNMSEAAHGVASHRTWRDAAREFEAILTAEVGASREPIADAAASQMSPPRIG
jgi:glycosyltransferase involved in cell wall biosynthesis